MSTSIRISEETKAKLEAIKRENETFDELISRLAVTRTEKDVHAMAGGGGEGLAAHMGQKHAELSDSLGKRTEN